MSRPTMDRAIEAIEAGDSELALELCKGMRHEWRFLHDLMAESMLGLVTYVQHKLGDEGVGEAWEESPEAGLEARHRAASSSATAATSSRRWRRPGAPTRPAAKGENPGAFTITEDEEKFTFEMNPCGSGQRLWRNGAYTRRGPLRRDRSGARLVLRPRGLPALLHPLRLHERAAADPLVRAAAVPLAPAARTSTTIPAPGTGTRTPENIPDEYWRRYGLERAGA